MKGFLKAFLFTLLAGLPVAGLALFLLSPEDDELAPAPADLAPAHLIVPTPDTSLPTASTGPTNPVLSPAHTPDYGERLKRGQAAVTFEIIDGMGKVARFSRHLDTVRLYRRLGRFWIDAPLWIDADGRIRCEGLEPGEHELELESACWGSQRHRFSVGKDEHRVDRLRTPVYRRVICVRFLHADGRPVSHVSSMFGRRSEAAELADVVRAMPDATVLRHGPVASREDPGCGTFRLVRVVDRVPKFLSFPTDDGRMYVDVRAGLRNTVWFDLGADTWGQDKVAFESTFTGPEWSEHRVTLPTVADFEQKINAMKPAEGATPGRRDLLESEPAVQANQPKSLEPAKSRLILRAKTALALFPQVEDVSGRPDWMSKQPDGSWWFDVAPRRVLLRVGDQRYYAAALEDVDLRSPGLHELKREYAPPELRLEVAPNSPTIRAFAITADVVLSALGRPLRRDDFDQGPPVPGDGGKEGKRLHAVGYLYPAATGSVTVNYDKGTFADRQTWHTFTVDVRVIGRPPWEMHENTRRGNSIIEERIDERVTLACIMPHIELTFRPGEASDVLKQPLQIKAPSGLALRVVSHEGAGLPFAQAAVIAEDEEETALHVRMICRAAHSRPDVSLTEEQHDRLLAGTIGDDELRRLVGDGNWLGFGGGKAARWAARNNAWYDVRQRVFGDDYGYMIAPAIRLQAGKRYALYLWANSRDDLRPDRRVIFEAKDGITDLGAIELPAYSE